MNKLEIQKARSQLKLRETSNGWEVYASVHGTNVFRWWKISNTLKDWYLEQFPEIKILTGENYE